MARWHKLTSKDGFVFAATGQKYVILARRAARTLRDVMGDVQIDLFTDRDVQDPVFDQVIRLENIDHRPKIEALRRSRFQHSLYLDCDTIVVAPVNDLFEMIRRHDIVASHEQYRSSKSSMILGPNGPPPSFPEVNTGVLGIRKSAQTQTLLRNWQKELEQAAFKWDQPLLRRLMFEKNYSLGIIPHDYNLMHTSWIRSMGRLMTAPRILHITRLHTQKEHTVDPLAPFDFRDILAPDVSRKLSEMLESDPTLPRVRGEAEVDFAPSGYKYKSVSRQRSTVLGRWMKQVVKSG